MASAKKTGKNNLLKFLMYMGLLLTLFYFISYLNFFPGAIDYQETEDTITLERGIETETYNFNKSELDTGELLRLSLLKMDINSLQNFLIAFVVFIHFSLLFFLERDAYKFLNFDKRLQNFVFVLVFILIFILLIVGYIQTLNSIEEKIKPLLALKQ